MSGLLSVLSVSAGTLLAIIVFLALVFWYVKDITQKKHTVLRNYPIIGRLRYFFEQLGEYFRQYFFTPAAGIPVPVVDDAAVDAWWSLLMP